MNFQEDHQNDEMDPILLQANKLNSDLGRFVRTCSFSSHLTGRFYQNNSMETHTAREQRIARMNAKRKKLERDVKVEDAKIRYLEKLLHLKEEKLRAHTSLQTKAHEAATRIQSFARGCLAKNQIELLRVERNIILYVALFLQSLYRGMRDRKRVKGMKIESLKVIQESAAAIQLQQHARGFLAKRHFFQAKRERDELEHRVSKIQALARASLCRIALNREHHRRLEYVSATKLQSCLRSYHARRILDGLRQKRRKKKPEKVTSLQDRRYSTYSVRADIPRKLRRQSAAVVTTNNEDFLTPRNVIPLPLWKKNSPKRHLNSNKIDSNSIHSNKSKGPNVTHKVPDDQGFILAQQKASQRVSRLERRTLQEAKKQQLEAKKVHEKLMQPEQNQMVLLLASAPTRTNSVQLDDTMVSSEWTYVPSSSMHSDVKEGNIESDDKDEFEVLIPENENDID